MPRYKNYDYNQTVMIAIELEKQIIAGTLEYAIHKLVEERVKIEPFEKKLKNEETGRPAYDPKVMLKIILAVNAPNPLFHPTAFSLRHCSSIRVW